MACGSCSGGAGGTCGCGSQQGCTLSCRGVQVHDWLPKGSPSSPSLVEVGFKNRRRSIYRNTRKLRLSAGDSIIVGAWKGIDLGHVTMAGELVLTQAREDARYKAVVRHASMRDLKVHRENRRKEEQELDHFRSLARRHNVLLKAVDAEWQLDRKCITFYFSTERKPKLGRLIKALRKRYRAQVILKRVTPREAAARIGGFGVCGRELCCATWMRSMPHVNMNAAKLQQLPLRAERLRGRCGQLKCCLNYELNHYVEALEEFPARDAEVRIKGQVGRVMQVDIFSRTVTVALEDDGPPDVVPLDAVQVPES